MENGASASAEENIHKLKGESKIPTFGRADVCVKGASIPRVTDRKVDFHEGKIHRFSIV